jgi:Spy/CpxP family protein refolding chaperone
MKTRLLVLLLAASVAGNATFLATAAREDDRGSLPMDRLGLDAAQRESMKPLRSQFITGRNEAHKRIRDLRGALADEIAKQTPDRARIAGIAARMAVVQEEMRPKFIQHLLDMRAVLRPSQRAALGDLLRAGGEPAMMSACTGDTLAPAPGGSER